MAEAALLGIGVPPLGLGQLHDQATLAVTPTHGHVPAARGWGAQEAVRPGGNSWARTAWAGLEAARTSLG